MTKGLVFRRNFEYRPDWLSGRLVALILATKVPARTNMIVALAVDAGGITLPFKARSAVPQIPTLADS